MTVPVTGCADDGGHALRVDTHEVVRMARRLHSVDGDRDGTVRAVLEADGEGGARGELTVELGLRRPRTDGTPGDQVGDELGAARASAIAPQSGARGAGSHTTSSGVIRRHAPVQWTCSDGDTLTHLIVSSSSHPTGMPISLMSLSSSLPILNPLLIWKLPSMSGSLIRPFHPTVVLGFSLRRVSALCKPDVQETGPPTPSRPSRPVIQVAKSFKSPSLRRRPSPPGCACLGGRCIA